MKASVDKETCIGCGLCEDTCPEVFVMEGDIAVTKEGEVPADAADSCKDAADACPVEAISIEG